MQPTEWKLKRLNVGKDVVQPELLSITDGRAKCYNHLGKKFGYFL